MFLNSCLLAVLLCLLQSIFCFYLLLLGIVFSIRTLNVAKRLFLLLKMILIIETRGKSEIVGFGVGILYMIVKHCSSSPMMCYIPSAILIVAILHNVSMYECVTVKEKLNIILIE